MFKSLFQKTLPTNFNLLLSTLALMIFNLPATGAPPVAVFGREDFFTLNASQTSKLKNSGFNTAILFVVDVEANGDLNYNGDHLIVQNGVYIGDPAWPTRLAALKVPPTSINRLEVCTGGAGARSWVNIKNLIATNGTGPTSILYKNFLALKNAIHMDAICNDDEVAYDAPSAATFNQMITGMGMKNTLCPYNNVSYWQSVFNNSEIDAVYLQCYDGGAFNNPATWNGYFGGFKVAPGDWSNDGLTTVAQKFEAWSPVISGGFIWQFEFISASDLAKFAAIINKAVDPLVVTPAAGFSGIAAYNERVFPANTVFTLTNASDTSLSWSVINTSSWLNVSISQGTLAVGSTSSVTVSLNTTVVTNLALGNYTANVIFSNRTSKVTVKRGFTLNTDVANWPIELSGYNAALLAPNTATAAQPQATGFDIKNSYCFYQGGFPGGSRGLPFDGIIASKVDPATAFQLGPYGAPDALLLGYNSPASGTLTLLNPQSFNSLAILASSANGGGSGTLVLNFTNGTQSQALNFNAPDWFFVPDNVAAQGFGRLKLGATLTAEDNGDSNPNLYQTTINLASLGLTQAIASITFFKPSDSGAQQNTAVFAVSGMPSDAPLRTPMLTAVPGTNGTVRLEWSSSAGAIRYRIKRSESSSGPFVEIGSISGTSFTDTNLANGSTYYYVVSAEGAGSESEDSIPANAMPGSYRGWVFGENPVAYWPLDETAGATALEIVQGSNGFYGGTYLFTTGGAAGAGFGIPHRIVNFNGSSGYAQVPRLIGQTDFTMVFWLRTTATGGGPDWYGGRGLVDGEMPGAVNDFGVALVGSKVGFGIGNPDLTLSSVKSVNNGAWRQIAVTRSSSSGAMKIYIDGTLDNSATGPTGARTTPTSLRIGSIQTGTANGFLSGSISDVAVFDRVLTADQIATLYSAATGLFYDVTLTNQLVGANLKLSWPGNGKLLESTNIAGPWKTNFTASPVLIVPSEFQKFYRIQTR
ncbi:MAG TPA: LamG-like jellyroll fold domain-containing protein [Verrucomicrobiae bacterium]|nr:LamG-like jellyroll fold domain-containing protein [Verrucomicrobiae bacterium]